MFSRTITVRHGDRVYRYQYVVKSVRVEGEPRQEVMASLGRVDDVTSKDKDELIRVLLRLAGGDVPEKGGDPDLGSESPSFGSIFAVERAWESLGLKWILRMLARKRDFGFDLERAVFAMVANRLIDPQSKYGTAEWLYRDVYLPTGTPLDADHLYLALSWLTQVQSEVELQLYRKLVRENRIDPTVVFYDTSAVWFEGRGPEGLAQHGRPKGTHPPNRRLILLGLVRSLNGWPISHHVFPGNTADVSTVEPVLRDLVERFGIRRFIFICDRGMISKAVIRFLEETLKVEYIIATKLRGDEEVRNRILSRQGRFLELDEQLGVKEVFYYGRRHVVCRNKIEVEADAARRAEIVETVRTKHLDRPCRASTKRAQKLLTNAAFGRYLTAVDGLVVLDPKKIAGDARYDGKWVLRTNIRSTDAPKEEIARLYKKESAIERDFRDLKSFFELRPIYHRVEPRVRGHVFVCVLAKVVARELEVRLHRSGFVGTSVEAVLDELSRVRVTEVGAGDTRRFVRGRLTSEQEALYRHLEINPHSLPRRLPAYATRRPRRTRLDNVKAEQERQARKQKRHAAWLAEKAAKAHRARE